MFERAKRVTRNTAEGKLVEREVRIKENKKNAAVSSQTVEHRMVGPLIK
jgi:hypothetical protein